jgi:protein-disulfide isomerase
MFKKILQSQNGKLYILLSITAVIFVVFTVSYLRSYVSYYKELYTFRKNIIASLTDENVPKPEYSKSDPYQGSLNARTVIFEYGDLSCEACKALQPTIKQLQDFYKPNNLVVIWKDFPITPTDLNIQAHEALHCANDQKYFAPYLAALYENQGQFTTTLFKDLAKKLSLNETTFNSCVDNRDYQSTVENNYREALRLGLDSTPTLFINNTQVNSGMSYEGLRNIIEKTK